MAGEPASAMALMVSEAPAASLPDACMVMPYSCSVIDLKSSVSRIDCSLLGSGLSPSGAGATVDGHDRAGHHRDAILLNARGRTAGRPTDGMLEWRLAALPVEIDAA
jgi:hypothetical protein